MGLRNWLSGIRNDQEDPSSQAKSTGSPGEHDPENPDVEISASERELREFVYLDRDSVVSLLASIEGTIKQERIEQIGARSEDRVSGGVNASISGVGAKVGGERVEMGESSSEVVHNYAIQSLFDELDQHRQRDDSLGVLDSDRSNGVELSEIARGDILRVDVELETHYLYRFYKVMIYIQENIPRSIGPEEEDVLELIGSLFGTEVPVSGRVLDFQVEDGEIQPVNSDGSDGDHLHIVGQLNARKLWQDIPDTLFDGEEYTIFCRVEDIYDKEPWQPLNLAQKIETVSPPLARILTRFMERAAVLAEEEASEQYSNDPDLDRWTSTLAEFDKQAGIDSVPDDLHRRFIMEYVSENGVPALTPSGGTELADFFNDYATYLRSQDVSISKSDEAMATDRMIFDDHSSTNNGQGESKSEGLQIETQIVAVYW